MLRTSASILLLPLIAVIAPGTARTSGADDLEPRAGVVTRPAVDPLPPADVARAHELPSEEAVRHFFERFRSLAGSWRAESTAGWSDVVTYEVIARGSVVMGTTSFDGSPERTMVTMYYVDGDRLVATHYCEARNQPHLVAEKLDPATGRAVFRFAGGGNLADRDRGHMDRVEFEFVDENRFRSRWTWYQDGSSREFEQIELRRIR